MEKKTEVLLKIYHRVLELHVPGRELEEELKRVLNG